MEIRKVETDKKEYLPLLLLADEQENMIDQYLERGDMYVLEDGGVKGYVRPGGWRCEGSVRCDG